MNNENPIHVINTIKEAERLQAAKGFHLPIHICCVLDEYSDFNNPIIHGIRDHCIQNHVLFTTRIYDSSKYRCDCDYIERLPALHIFIKRAHIKTYYPDTRPIQHVDDAIKLYNTQIEKQKAKKQFWRKQFVAILSWFRSLTHRKTRMELYTEENSQVRHSVDWTK